MSNPVDVLPDPERLRRLQQLLLERLAKGPDPVFAEIAEEVRSGRMTLRDAALGPAYRETFAAATSAALRAAAGRTPEEIAAAAAANPVEAKIARLEAEPPPIAAPEPAAADDADDEPVDSFMVRPQAPDRDAGPPRRERWHRRW